MHLLDVAEPPLEVDPLQWQADELWVLLLDLLEDVERGLAAALLLLESREANVDVDLEKYIVIKICKQKCDRIQT